MRSQSAKNPDALAKLVHRREHLRRVIIKEQVQIAEERPRDVPVVFLVVQIKSYGVGDFTVEVGDDSFIGHGASSLWHLFSPSSFIVAQLRLKRRTPRNSFARLRPQFEYASY